MNNQTCPCCQQSHDGTACHSVGLSAVDAVVMQDYIDGIYIALSHLESERVVNSKHRMNKLAVAEFDAAIFALKEAVGTA